MLTQDLLRELFDYNPETGELSRKDGTFAKTNAALGLL